MVLLELRSRKKGFLFEGRAHDPKPTTRNSERELPTQLRPLTGRELASVLQLIQTSEWTSECIQVLEQPDPLALAPLRERGCEINPTLRQTCPKPKPWAQFAFKDLMIHGILQFTLRIAFRCVLHRCESQDIRC